VKYLLDTNIVSEPLRTAPSRSVLARLRRHAEELAIASVAWHELWFGCLRLPISARRSAIERYLNEVVELSIPIVAYDARAAAWHAAERARLGARGSTPPFVDGQIAAIAATNELVLVTRNGADYAFFRGLKIEDWNAA
jgi:tRNA(fMet)-specific endonuclease VapC